MFIDWKARFGNPLFIAQLVTAVVLPLIIGMGYEWEDMTSWGTLASAIWAAMGNPVIVVSMLLDVWGVVNNPTVRGFSDRPEDSGYDKVEG